MRARCVHEQVLVEGGSGQDLQGQGREMEGNAARPEQVAKRGGHGRGGGAVVSRVRALPDCISESAAPGSQPALKTRRSALPAP